MAHLLHRPFNNNFSPEKDTINHIQFRLMVTQIVLNCIFTFIMKWIHSYCMSTTTNYSALFGDLPRNTPHIFIYHCCVDISMSLSATTKQQQQQKNIAKKKLSVVFNFVKWLAKTWHQTCGFARYFSFYSFLVHLKRLVEKSLASNNRNKWILPKI